MSPSDQSTDSLPLNACPLQGGQKTGGDAQSTRAKGASAEEEAADYLEKQGFTIVARNFQIHIGEIDIIARDKDGMLVFVEVKSSRGTRFGHPFFWVDRNKQRTLARVAQFYLAKNRTPRCPARFDVIAIINGKIEHLRNAFLV
jgi:putative endonuclease